jgi:hypothetical protein
MEVMRPRTKTRTWANERPPSETQLDASAPVDRKISTDSLREPPGRDGDSDVDDSNDPDSTTVSDMDWMKRHMSKRVESAEVDKSFEQSDDEEPINEEVFPRFSFDRYHAD